MKPAVKYESPLRDEQKAETRRRIVAAAERLMQDADLVELTFAAVAREAGVQERTVYRHFATKGDLLDALWDALDPRIGTASFPDSEAALVEAPRRVFPAFDDNENLMRAFWSTPQGREFRLRVNDKRKAAIRKAVADAVKDLPANEARWVTAAAQLLYSGAAWQTMKDYWGFSGDEAGKASSFMLQLIFDAARRRANTKGPKS
jgi:AcrR family transcriptional regulator